MTMQTDWKPPPPGDTRAKLPDHILAMVVLRPYTSTACEMAQALASAVVRYPECEDELQFWEKIMHDWCRLNNKFSDVKCACPCGHPNRKEDHE